MTYLEHGANLVANLSEIIKESSGQMDWAIIWYESVYNKDKTEKEKGKEMFHVWGKKKKKKVQEQGVSNFSKPTAIELI